MKMTTKEMAQLLNGCQYRAEITVAEEQLAKENNLVVVMGYSDDNAELYGAIRDEVGCFKGGTIYLDIDGHIVYPTEYSNGYQGNLFQIEAVWCDQKSAAAWTYHTDIPHETFKVYEDDELFCIGIVFSLDDLK